MVDPLASTIRRPAQLARRWRCYAGNVSIPVRMSPADPAVTDLCRSLVTGLDIERSVQQAAVAAERYHDEDVMVGLATALFRACLDEGIAVRSPGLLLELARIAYRQAAATRLVIGMIKDPLTGLDSIQCFASLLWAMSRDGRPVFLIVARDYGVGSDLTGVMEMTRRMGRCAGLLRRTVTRDGTGIGCVRDEVEAAAIVEQLEWSVPTLRVTAHLVPHASLDQFARWLALVGFSILMEV